uniref:Uncharacterized protein n=2 Tax=Ditylum brightwellii TaxID=49249 RepID=A0A7S1ZEM0_9STRA
MTDGIAAGRTNPFMPQPKDPLTLALLPRDMLTGEEGLKRIQKGMNGVERHSIEELDGFEYEPSHSSYLDINLVMVASYLGNVIMLKHWIEEVGVNPNVRNGELTTALIQAIANKRYEARDYLLSLDCIEIGLPEAAALAYRDLVPKLIIEYDSRPPEEKPYGMAGADIAFIFSGLSGDIDWVLTLMKNASNVNVGQDNDVGNVGRSAALSGNVDLVRKLVNGHGVQLESNLSRRPIAFEALCSPDMMQFFIEELKISSLSEWNDSWNTLLDSALLNRFTSSINYLLDKKSAKTWDSWSETRPIEHSIFIWNAPEITKKLLPSLHPGCVQQVLRQAMRLGDYRIVQILVDKYGANVSDAPDDYVTVLEEAIWSGSIELVKYILKKDPETLKFRHSNGYNAFVAAAKSGNNEIFELFSQKLPDYLNYTFWSGMTLLMVACSEPSSAVVKLLLDERFYETHCRGKALDVNTACDNGNTALWYVVQSGFAKNVDLILSKREWLGLKELQHQHKINDLFVRACMSERFADLIDCFERHGLFFDNVSSSSLSMTAAENGTLFEADPCQVHRLIALDKRAGLHVPNEVLLCAIICHAPNWAIDRGIVAKIISTFLEKEDALNSRTVFEQVLARCDKTSLKLLDFSKLLCDFTPAGLVLIVLRNSEMKDGTSRKAPHPKLTERRGAFLQWILRVMQKEESETSYDDELTYKVLRAVVSADLSLRIVSSIAQPKNCSKGHLISLLQLSCKYCQLDNCKMICDALSSTTKIVEVRCKDEMNLVLAALCNTQLSDTGRKERFALVSWLVLACKVDLSHTDKNGTNALMLAAGLGYPRLFNWICENIESPNWAAQDNKGKTLLYYAIKGGNLQIVQKTMQFSENDDCGEDGEKPIHVAAAEGKFAVLRHLVETAKVDVNQRDAADRTVLDYNIYSDNLASREYLKHILPASVTDTSESIPRSDVNKWLEKYGKSASKHISRDTQGMWSFSHKDHSIIIEVPDGEDFVYMLASFDGRKYEVKDDSQRMLLDNIVPGIGKTCFALKRSPGKDDKVMDAIASRSYRVSNLESQGFQDALENFVYDVLSAAERLSICIAKRQLLKRLEQYSGKRNESDEPNTHSLDRINTLVGAFTKDPPKTMQPSQKDVTQFQKSLSTHMEEYSISINTHLQVSGNGECVFNCGELGIKIQPASAEKMRLSSVLWDTEKDGPITENLVKYALELNYLRKETSGGVLTTYSFLRLDRRNNKLSYVMEDWVNLQPFYFRNIMGSFMNTALDLHKRLRNIPEDSPFDEISDDLNRKKVKIIDELRGKKLSILSRIFGQEDASVIHKQIDLLVTTIMDTKDLDLWCFVLKAVFERSNDRDDVDTASLRSSIFNTACQKGMLNGDILKLITDGAAPSFEVENIASVFYSKKLLKDGKAASIAQKMVELHDSRCIECKDDSTAHALSFNALSLSALNIIGVAKMTDNFDETTACLDWIFSRSNEETLVSNSFLPTLLHHSASQGHKELLNYLLGRLPHLELDEETLVWACKQNHASLVGFIVDQSKDLPRARAIKVAAAYGSVEVMKALLGGRDTNETLSDTVGQSNSEGSDEENTRGEDLSKAIAEATKDAIASSKWDILEHLISDDRLDIPLLSLLEMASSCWKPKKCIRIILESRFAANQSYTCRIPWQAQALVIDNLLSRLLKVLVVCNLPTEIGELVWSFYKPDCEDTPSVSSAYMFWEKFRTPIERDLDIERISRDGSSFLLPSIGELTIRDGVCCIKKRFDVSETRTGAEIPLGMSAQLGGSFLATRDLDSSLWLKRVVSLGPSFNYRQLRLTLLSFRRASNIIDTVISNAKKFNVMVPASDLSAVAPDARSLNKIQSASMVSVHGRKVSITYFAGSSCVRITTPYYTQDQDSRSLLESNLMLTTDEAFFCIDINNIVCAAMYVSSDDANDSHCLSKLIAKADGRPFQSLG